VQLHHLFIHCFRPLIMERKKNLETCLIIVTGLLIIFLIKEWYPLLIIAITVGFIGVFFNKPASWINWLWYKIGDLLGKIIPKVILSAVFFLFLFPVSMLYRISCKDRLTIKAKNRNTMWTERDYSYSMDDLTKPW
jgi:hypothetical protein